MPTFDGTLPASLGLSDGGTAAPNEALGSRPASLGLSDGTTAPGDLTETLPPGVVPSAVLTGLTNVTLAGNLFEKILTETTGVDRDMLEAMARTAHQGPLGKGLSFITTLGAEMLLGGGVFSLGRRAAVAGLQRAVPAGMARFAAPAAETLTAGQRFQRSFGRVAARNLDVAGGSPALANLGITTAVPKPVVERGAEILGGSLAIGGLYGTGELTDGASLDEALKAGAFAAGLALSFETAFTVGAKALFPGARELDYEKLLSATSRSPLARTAAKEITDELNVRANAARDKLIELQGAPVVDTKKVARATKKLARAEQEQKSWIASQEMSDLFRSYLRETPRDRASAVETILLKLAKTPEQLAGEMGPATAKMVELGRLATLETSMGRSLNNVQLREIDKAAREALGAWKLGGVKGRKGGDYILDSLEKWQRGLELDNPKLAAAFQDLQTLLLNAENALRGSGLMPPPGVTAATLGRRQIPMVLNRLEPTADLVGKLVGRPKSDEQLTRELATALMKAGKNELDAVQSARKVVFGHRTRTPFLGAGRTSQQRTVWSMFDETSLNQLFAGKTFQEVVDLGAPIIRDPVVGIEAYLNSVARRVSYAKRFGPTGDIAKLHLRKMAAAEGASLTLYDNLVQAVFGSSYGTVAEQAFAAAITNTQTATRMGLAVLPNMWQWINTPVLTGPKSMIRGLVTRYQKGSPVNRAAEASAIHDSMIRNFRESFLDPYFRTPMGKFADSVLIGTGFTWAERWNRLWAFHAGANYATRTLPKAVEGRLRGNALDIARRRFQGMGQDLDDLVRKARTYKGSTVEQAEALLLENDMAMLKNIGLGAVRQTQFLPDKTRLPTFWNTPTGRVAFQFKSFALNQTRMVRDYVVNEAAKGNVGPLVYMTAAFPLGGEVALNLRQMIRDGELNRPDSGLARMVESASAVGAFALAGDFYRAATWGPEQVGRFAIGPTAEDVTYLLSAIFSADFDRIVARANKLPSYRAALSAGTLVVGAGFEGVPRLTEALQHYLDEDSEAESPVEPVFEAPTLRELQQQAP